MMFTARCRMGVRMRMKTNAGSVIREKSHPGSAMRRRANAPATRSYWSATGHFEPRSFLNLRLKKLFTRSPRSAPTASRMTVKSV